MNTKGRTIFFFLLLQVCFGANVLAQVLGCTDPMATNYQPGATRNDGSCVYAAASVGPASTFRLPDSLAESSGLLLHRGFLWSHNDDTDPGLYFWKPEATPLLSRKSISGVKNNDWEDLTRDDSYYYIGDFGNNGSGNRRNLNILRIADPSLQGTELKADTIFFSYEDQKDFTAQAGNSTDFDCEAMIAFGDSLYLFTKQWLSQNTACYVLPKTPGTHIARLRESFDLQGLVTGASVLPDRRLLLLCGYSKMLQPFVYLCYDFEGRSFFSGNKRKLNLDLGFHQVEGISTENGLDVFVSNEQLSQFITVAPQIHRLDLRPYLSAYLSNSGKTLLEDPVAGCSVIIQGHHLYLRTASNLVSATWEITDSEGRVLDSGVTKEHTIISVQQLPAGLYYLRMGSGTSVCSFKWLKD
jgi:hypothetical protein